MRDYWPEAQPVTQTETETETQTQIQIQNANTDTNTNTDTKRNPDGKVKYSKSRDGIGGQWLDQLVGGSRSRIGLGAVAAEKNKTCHTATMNSVTLQQ